MTNNEDDIGTPRESCGGVKLGYVPEYYCDNRYRWFPIPQIPTHSPHGIPGRPLSHVERAVGAVSYEQAYAIAWLWLAQQMAQSQYSAKARVATVEINYEIKSKLKELNELPFAR